MSENVVSLRGVERSSEAEERRAEVINAVAEAFDKYVDDYGVVPDGIVAVFGGVKQTAVVSWLVRGESEGGATSMQALAAFALMRG